jgi:NTE family protein
LAEYALVLSGGASRGAYQAGVLRFIFHDLAPRLGVNAWPKYVSGTSVGALNGIAAVSQDQPAVARLSSTWQQMKLNDVFELEAGGLLSTVRSLFSPKEGVALLDASPLRRLVSERLPHAEMRRALDSGACKAFIVSATELATGTNVLFTDSADPHLDLKPLPGARVARVSMTTDHLLASAAIPLLFPPVQVGSRLYADGGLRQNTPLRPVLKAGARRVLIVSPHVQVGTEANHPLEGVVPSLPFLAGKSLNALMSDPVERDLQMARQINDVAEWGEAKYGPGFRDALQQDLGMHAVDLLSLRPSADLGRLASAIYAVSPPKVGRQLRWLLDTLADQVNTDQGESDLLAYLLFDRSFTGPAEALGFDDARGREEEIARFLLGDAVEDEKSSRQAG